MDKATLDAALAAQQAVREHDNSCKEGCQDIGSAWRKRGAAKRCAAGGELWDTWDSFRPARLPGSRTTKGPDGKLLNDCVIELSQSIGPYTILTLLRDASNGTSVKDWQTHLRVEYVAYVDGVSTTTRWYDTDLDTVLLFAMDVRRNSDKGSHAYYYAAKVLGVPVVED